ncbi:MAG: hypothetical protein ACXAEF_07610 [Candidatus Thorarchaeota archaeon]
MSNEFRDLIKDWFIILILIFVFLILVALFLDGFGIIDFELFRGEHLC